MDPNNKKGIILFFVLAVVGFLLLAAGISNVDFSQRNEIPEFFQGEDAAETPAAPEPRADVLPNLAPVLQDLAAAIFVMLVIFGIMFYLWPEYTKDMIRRYLVGAIWLMSFVVLLYYLREIDFFNFLSEFEAGSGSAAAAVIPDFVRNPSLWLAFLVGAGLLMSLALGGFLLYTRLAARLTPLAQIRFEAKETLQEIRAGVDLRNAIVACYFNMCRILVEKQRIEREQGMTPREFAVRLADSGLPATQVNRLTRLFELVRYGTHDFTPAEAEEAIACLSAIGEAEVRKFNRQPGLHFLQADGP